MCDPDCEQCAAVDYDETFDEASDARAYRRDSEQIRDAYEVKRLLTNYINKHHSGNGILGEAATKIIDACVRDAEHLQNRWN